MESLDFLKCVIPEGQKQLFRRFYRVRDRQLLKLYELLESKDALPPHLKDKIERRIRFDELK